MGLTWAFCWWRVLEKGAVFVYFSPVLELLSSPLFSYTSVEVVAVSGLVPAVDLFSILLYLKIPCSFHRSSPIASLFTTSHQLAFFWIAVFAFHRSCISVLLLLLFALHFTPGHTYHCCIEFLLPFLPFFTFHFFGHTPPERHIATPSAWNSERDAACCLLGITFSSFTFTTLFFVTCMTMTFTLSS